MTEHEKTKVEPSGRAMKAQTAAKKLGIYLPATPPEFQESAVTHAELRQLQENPPQWLEELRRDGPHPRPVVAQKLGISVTALKNNGLDQPLTTAEIKEYLANQPEWLRAARTQLAQSRAAADAPTDSADSAAVSVPQGGVEGSASGVERPAGGVEGATGGVEGAADGVEGATGGVEGAADGVEGATDALQSSPGGVESEVTGVETGNSAT